MSDDLKIGCINPACTSGKIAGTRKLCTTCFHQFAQDVAMFKTTWEKLEAEGRAGPLKKPGMHQVMKDSWERRQKLIKDRWNKLKEKTVSDENGETAAETAVATAEQPKLSREEQRKIFNDLMRKLGPSFTAKEAQDRLKTQGVIISDATFYKWKQALFSPEAPKAPAAKPGPKPGPKAGRKELVPAAPEVIAQAIRMPAQASPRIKFKLIDVEIDGAALPPEVMGAIAQAFARGG